jgi:hypothetical protein
VGKTQRPYDTPVIWKKYEEPHLWFIDPSTDHLQTAGEVKKYKNKVGLGL